MTRRGHLGVIRLALAGAAVLVAVLDRDGHVAALRSATGDEVAVHGDVVALPRVPHPYALTRALTAVSVPVALLPAPLARALRVVLGMGAALLEAACALVVAGSRRVARALTARETDLRLVRAALHGRNRDLAMMTGVTTALSRVTDLSGLLAAVRDVLAHESQTAGGRVLLRDLAEDRLTVAGRWGLPDDVEPEGTSLPTAALPCPGVVREARPVVAADFREIPALAASGLGAARPTWRAYACVPLAAGADVRGALELFTAEPEGFTDERVQTMVAVGREIGCALRNMALLAQVQSTGERLRYLSARLMEVREAEHRRLAREFHDEIGQALTALKMNLQMAGRACEAAAVVPRLDDSVEIVERVLTQMRSLFVELRPADLDDLGLVPALRSYLDRQARRADLVAEMVTEASLERLPAELETACYRLVQEALTNIIRHAGARHVRVELHASGAGIDVLVRDDGRGFDVAAVRRRGGQGSLGLLGMEERVALLGGSLAIESVPGRGTTVRAYLPLTAHEPRHEADERGGAA